MCVCALAHVCMHVCVFAVLTCFKQFEAAENAMLDQAEWIKERNVPDVGSEDCPC